MAPKKKPIHKNMHKKVHKLRPRNDDAIPDDILLTPAPILGLQSGFGSGGFPPARPSKVRRAASAVRRKFAPEAATINKDHLIGVGANAAGGIATALVASELVDNVGAVPLAVGATVVGGLGSAFLKGNWQRIAQGVLGAGVGQLGTAYLTERALKKAAAAQKAAGGASSGTPPAAPGTGKRNAYLPAVDEDYMVRAMERSERRLGAMLAEDDQRNGYGDGVIDAELFDDYGWAA